MPRIIPDQLLGCLKVLLDENAGIKSIGDVKRISGLMSKYSKKLVSKCVYVLILKSTKTDLLEEFMKVGGWALVHSWLSESIRTENWYLVQDVLELLLLCPVNVERLKVNSAPKLVKGLCREGGTEHVRILARKLVDQWLKVIDAAQLAAASAALAAKGTTVAQSAILAATASVLGSKVLAQTVSPNESVLSQVTAVLSPQNNSTKIIQNKLKASTTKVVAPKTLVPNKNKAAVAIKKADSSPDNSASFVKGVVSTPKSPIKGGMSPHQNVSIGSSPNQLDTDAVQNSVQDPHTTANATNNKSSLVVSPTVSSAFKTNIEEQDPLADVGDAALPLPSKYSLTRAQKKAKQEGLIYKIVIKDGKQVLAKVSQSSISANVPVQRIGQTNLTSNTMIDMNKSNEEEEEEEDVLVDDEFDESSTQEDLNNSLIDKDDLNDSQQDDEEIITPNSFNESSLINQTNDEDNEMNEIDDETILIDEDDEEDDEEVQDETTNTSVKILDVGNDDPNKANQSKSTKNNKTNNDDDDENGLMKNKNKMLIKTSNSSSSSSSASSNDKKTDDKSKNEKRDKDGSKEIRDGSDRKSDKYKDKDRSKHSSSSKSSSSSSSHKSSSSSASKSSSSVGSSSSSSKPKSSSSSSSHRSSSDKHRSSDRDRSSSKSKDKSRDKDRSGSSSSNKHRSSSESRPSSSTSSSSKDKDRDKRDKEKHSSSSSSSSAKKDKSEKSDKYEKSEKDKLSDKDALALETDSSKKSKLERDLKDDKDSSNDSADIKPTSITIPSKKASMSIEIKASVDKLPTVKTYKSQFRSHGLTEEAPPPPSRKGLKKPTSLPATTGVTLPTTFTASLKRPSPPPSGSPLEKKAKIDINILTVPNEKPGAIKLIAPKRMQTLVETNLFSEALSAATTGSKKPVKRKRALSLSAPPSALLPGKEDDTTSMPGVGDLPKVAAPLKFYQDTLEDSKNDSMSDLNSSVASDANKENSSIVDSDDEDAPLKKVKECLQQKMLQEQKDGTSLALEATTGATSEAASEEAREKESEKLHQLSLPPMPIYPDGKKPPGPGCGPNGPPGVLVVHRRSGPKKKLTWRPQEQLEEVRFFDLDENERVNVTKVSFMDMKNIERFHERDALHIIARRGFEYEDNMEPQTEWRPLIIVDDVPEHPNGSNSKQRKIQAEREMTTLRALYFSPAMIPDSPAEAEIEPHLPISIPIIPVDDLTGNPDGVNDFTSMPWPEPKGSPPRNGDMSLAGTGGLSGFENTDVFMNPNVSSSNFNMFNNFGANLPQHQQHAMNNPQMGGMMGPNGPQNMPPAIWQNQMMNNGPGPGQGPGQGGNNGPMMGGHPFQMNRGMQGNNNNGPTNMNQMNVGPPPNFMNGPGPFGPNGGNSNNNAFMSNGPPQCGQPGFNNGPMFNNMGNGPRPLLSMGPPMMNSPNMGGGNGPNNWQRNNKNNGGGGNPMNWRPAGSGPNRDRRDGRDRDRDRDMRDRDGRDMRDIRDGRDRDNSRDGNNSGVCKAFMRGHCRNGKSCKFIHPKSKRL